MILCAALISAWSVDAPAAVARQVGSVSAATSPPVSRPLSQPLSQPCHSSRRARAHSDRRAGGCSGSCGYSACHYFWRSRQATAEASHEVVLERAAMGQVDLAQSAELHTRHVRFAHGGQVKFRARGRSYLRHNDSRWYFDVGVSAGRHLPLRPEETRRDEARRGALCGSLCIRDASRGQWCHRRATSHRYRFGAAPMGSDVYARCRVSVPHRTRRSLE